MPDTTDTTEAATEADRAAIHARWTAALAAQRPNPRFAAVLAARGIVVRTGEG